MVGSGLQCPSGPVTGGSLQGTTLEKLTNETGSARYQPPNRQHWALILLPRRLGVSLFTTKSNDRGSNHDLLTQLQTEAHCGEHKAKYSYSDHEELRVTQPI